MSSGIWNLIIGALMIAGGASGRFSLIGTESSTLLAGLGAALCGYGGIQIYKARR